TSSATAFTKSIGSQEGTAEGNEIYLGPWWRDNKTVSATSKRGEIRDETETQRPSKGRLGQYRQTSRNISAPMRDGR
ncbi:hypothetical protein J6590_099285, partial [Homalodisca vitripennis]